MTLVIDASVAVKWVLSDRPGEYDTDKALALLLKIGREDIPLLQPEHWRIEVLSVVARFAPERFADTLQLLDKLNASRIEFDRGSGTRCIPIPAIEASPIRHSLSRHRHRTWRNVYNGG